MHSFGRVVSVVALVCITTGALVRTQGGAEPLFAEAVRREGLLRTELASRASGPAPAALLERLRTLIKTYEDIARLFPKSAQAEKALLQGGSLAAALFWELGQDVDRSTALRLFGQLEERYPESPLVADATAQKLRLKDARPAASEPAAAPASRVARRAPATVLQSIRREVLPDALRITLAMEGEAPFSDQRASDPSLLQVDLHETIPATVLAGTTVSYADDAVREVRVGRPAGGRTQITLHLRGTPRHSVYSLYNPYRIVIDVERSAATGTSRRADTAAGAPVRGPASATPARTVAPRPSPSATPAGRTTAERSTSTPTEQAEGGLSLSRQLGLGVTRVVIDPGHGGRDPGAEGPGLTEAELTLDIALRLEKLLAKEGVAVVLTRRDDTFVALEERTALANSADADLFLSIHTNASGDLRARGIETYFLNFASTPGAEAVAARENAGSARSMRELPDIVRAIALNNKIDESQDFARTVQSTMYERLRRVNRQARNLGVKQAPFAVLIGATMPSVLVEISFITNRDELSLLRTTRYRNQIADALFTGVMRYQRSLKAAGRTAATR